MFFTFVLQTQAHTNLDVNNKIVCPKKTNNMPNQIMAAIEKKAEKKRGDGVVLVVLDKVSQ